MAPTGRNHHVANFIGKRRAWILRPILNDGGAELDAAELGGPYRVADSMGFDEIIDPRDIRNVLLRGLALSAGREAEAPEPLARRGALP